MLVIIFKIFVGLTLALGICAAAGMFVFLGSFDIRDGLTYADEDNQEGL